MLEFYSIDSENNEVRYVSVFERHSNTFIFDDRTTPNTKVFLTIGEEFVIERKGKINMNFRFNKSKLTEGLYENDMGLSINFQIETTDVYFTGDNFYVSYDLYLDGEKISNHVIKIRFF